MLRAGVVVISDGCFHGRREDRSGPLIVERLQKDLGAEVESTVVPDDREQIKEAMCAMSERGLELIITTGGTGFGPRDVTPEATAEIIERDVPGIPAALLINGLSSTPHAMLSRGRAGLRKKSLIVNLPGSPRAVGDGMKILIPVIPHAIDMMNGGGHE